MKETNVILILQLQEVSDEQKNKLRKTERALKVAEVFILFMKFAVNLVPNLIIVLICYLSLNNFVGRNGEGQARSFLKNSRVK